MIRKGRRSLSQACSVWPQRRRTLHDLPCLKAFVATEPFVVYRGDLFTAFVLHLPFGFTPASLTVSHPYFRLSISTRVVSCFQQVGFNRSTRPCSNSVLSGRHLLTRPDDEKHLFRLNQTERDQHRARYEYCSRTCTTLRLVPSLIRASLIRSTFKIPAPHPYLQ